jgi:membrane-bound serine protease (ClpP class)
MVHGERWRARSPAALEPGDRVRVDRLDGLTLDVSPAAESSTFRSASS